MPDLPGNGTRTVYYNQMATLLFSTGKNKGAEVDAAYNTHVDCLDQVHIYDLTGDMCPYAGEDSIKQLFARGTHRRYDYSTLFVMGTYYFLGAALCAGSAISSG